MPVPLKGGLAEEPAPRVEAACAATSSACAATNAALSAWPANVDACCAVRAGSIVCNWIGAEGVAAGEAGAATLTCAALPIGALKSPYCAMADGTPNQLETARRIPIIVFISDLPRPRRPPHIGDAASRFARRRPRRCSFLIAPEKRPGSHRRTPPARRASPQPAPSPTLETRAEPHIPWR